MLYQTFHVVSVILYIFASPILCVSAFYVPPPSHFIV
jgi:hypothetical protein